MLDTLGSLIDLGLNFTEGESLLFLKLVEVIKLILGLQHVSCCCLITSVSPLINSPPILQLVSLIITSILLSLLTCPTLGIDFTESKPLLCLINFASH